MYGEAGDEGGENWARLVCLCWFFWFLAFTGAFGAVILYDYNDGQAYGRILAELTEAEVQGQPSSQLLRRLSEEDVLAIEAYDVQAAVLQQNSQVPYYWYPHYTATVVLAVADTCPFPITGWQSLETSPVSLSLTADEPAALFFMQAISYGFGRESVWPSRDGPAAAHPGTRAFADGRRTGSICRPRYGSSLYYQAQAVAASGSTYSSCRPC